jgi:putative ABC transport system substrate-binding protein
LRIEEATLRLSLAARCHALAEVVAVGGLVSYSLNWNDQFRRAAEYVDRVLKGAKPADLRWSSPTCRTIAIYECTAAMVSTNV